jgi:phosphatidylethanolamine/phosphatidyl-N-methylethanolamine N-methyltransferase
MLDKAKKRIAEKGLANCDVLEMDATKMTFADNSYDVVYAPYVISVVPDPVAVAKEMYRVCRPGGRVVILNHFKSANPIMSKIETAISPMTVHIGFTADLDLPGFLDQAELSPVSIEKVNVPKIWTLITVVKD